MQMTFMELQNYEMKQLFQFFIEISISDEFIHVLFMEFGPMHNIFHHFI